MRKDIVITLEEECVDCPMLSLETKMVYYYDGTTYKTHNCEHIKFCKKIREHWTNYNLKKEQEK